MNRQSPWECGIISPDAATSRHRHKISLSTLPRMWALQRRGSKEPLRVAFSDESGTGSKRDELNTVVAAILLNFDVHWPKLADDVESAIRIEGCDPSRYEIHATDLFNDIRRGVKRPTEENIKFKNRATMILASSLAHLFNHGVPVFAAAVNRAGYAAVRPMHPQFADIDSYTAAFSQCLREVDNWVHSDCPKEKILWISDHAGAYEPTLKDALRSIREVQQMNLNELFKVSLDFPEPHFAHIVDTIYFGHSQESRALQLADMCATILALDFRGDPIVRPFAALLQPSLKNVVAPLFLGMDKRAANKSR